MSELIKVHAYVSQKQCINIIPQSFSGFVQYEHTVASNVTISSQNKCFKRQLGKILDFLIYQINLNVLQSRTFKIL